VGAAHHCWLAPIGNAIAHTAQIAASPTNATRHTILWRHILSIINNYQQWGAEAFYTFNNVLDGAYLI
jgi:hypothetical protein